METPTLNTLGSLNNPTSAVSIINSNNAIIATALGNTLDRSGSDPNQMNSVLDMNSYNILNLPAPATVNSPARLIDVMSNPTITVPPVGTSGSVVGLLNSNKTDSGNNTFSGINTFSSSNTFTDGFYLKAGPIVDVKAFGALGNGSADDTASIQAAIDSLPASGGVVIFPVGNYKITATINIGNGTSSVASTKQGIVLQGMGMPVTSTVSVGYLASAGPKLSWAGAVSTPMVSVKGPLVGWGVVNLEFDGGGAFGVSGLLVTSAQFGECRNCVFNGCFYGINSRTVEIFGSLTNTDSLHNNYTNILINLPNGANSVGIFFTGSGAGSPTSDTDYSQVVNVTVSAPFSTGVVQYAIYLQVCDSCTFNNIHLIGGVDLVGIAFDYSISNLFPSANMFYAMDMGNIPVPYAVAGSPGAACAPNYIYGLGEANGARLTASVVGVNYSPSILGGSNIRLIGQTAALTAVSLCKIPIEGLYRVNYYMDITTVGSAGTIQLTINYADNIVNPRIFSSAAISTTTSTYTSGSTIIFTDTAHVPTYSTTFAGVTGNPQYALLLNVEKLQ